MSSDIKLSNLQLQQLLQDSGQAFGNAPIGSLFSTQMATVNDQMNTLNGKNSGGKTAPGAGVIAGKAIAGLQGLTDILGKSMNLARIDDLSPYKNQLNELDEIGATDYNSFEQLSSGYDQLARLGSNINTNKIKSLSEGEAIGGVLSTTATGAAAGLTVGGPIGAAVGGVIGLGSGLAGVLTGNRKVRDAQNKLNLENAQKTFNAKRNLEAAGEKLMEYNFRNGIANRAEEGGKITRKRISLNDFASRVLKTPAAGTTQFEGHIVRRHGEGGTIIRLKR